MSAGVTSVLCRAVRTSMQCTCVYVGECTRRHIVSSSCVVSNNTALSVVMETPVCDVTSA